MYDKNTDAQSRRRLPASISSVNPTPSRPRALVPYTSHSPINLTSQYGPGSTISQIRPNYQSALVTANDPFRSIERAPVPQVNFQKSSPPSPYVQKGINRNLLCIEPKFIHLKNPVHIAKLCFPPYWHFIPESSQKPLRFYTDILFQTGSIQVKATPDKNDPSKIIFHSLYIQKVLTLSEWNDSPYTPQKLNGHDTPFTYYDYISMG